MRELPLLSARRPKLPFHYDRQSAHSESQRQPPLPAPGGRRWGDRLREVEFDAEVARSGSVGAAQGIGIGARVDTHDPAVGHRCAEALRAERRDAFGIDREYLLAGCSGAGGVAAVLGDLVDAAVLVAVIVLEAQARPGPGDDPGARSVPAAVRGADMEGDFHPVCAAGAEMDNHRLAGEIGIGRVGAHQPSGIGLAAMLREAGHERSLRVSGGQGGGATGEREQQQSKGGPGVQTGHSATLVDCGAVVEPGAILRTRFLRAGAGLLARCFFAALGIGASGPSGLGLNRHRSATGQRQHSGFRALQI